MSTNASEVFTEHVLKQLVEVATWELTNENPHEKLISIMIRPEGPVCILGRFDRMDFKSIEEVAGWLVDAEVEMRGAA